MHILHLMKTNLFVIGLLFTINVNAQTWSDFKFKNGDLLFQDLDCGELCDAIEKVTPSLNNRHFSHIGLIYITGDSVYVLEAIETNVRLTSLFKFISRQSDNNGNPKVIVGRLKKEYEHLNKPALDFALRQIGKGYDDVFIYDNGKYYCSELIYDAYKIANDYRPFFMLQPMTFKDPRTGDFMPVWINYYKNKNMDIPQGKPGCSPGSIATSEKIDIIYAFY
jgi:uncharacterized protein YycO